MRGIYWRVSGGCEWSDGFIELFEDCDHGQEERMQGKTGIPFERGGPSTFAFRNIITSN